MKKTGLIALIIAVISCCCSGVCLVLLLQKPPVPDNTEAAPSAPSAVTQYVMYVGTNDKDTYKPLYTNDEAREIVDSICLQYFEGYTLQEAIGSWTDEKNNKTHEYTLVCYFDDADASTVYRAADDVIKALNQNTVLIEKSEIIAEYYSGK